MVTIIAILYGKSEKCGDLKQALFDLGQNVKKEEGNIQFILHEREDDPTVFVCYEAYKNEEAFQAHLNTSHSKKFNADSKKHDWFRADVEIIRLKKVNE